MLKKEEEIQHWRGGKEKKGITSSSFFISINKICKFSILNIHHHHHLMEIAIQTAQQNYTNNIRPSVFFFGFTESTQFRFTAAAPTPPAIRHAEVAMRGRVCQLSIRQP